MFEINLVPDVKGELLKKLRLRNLVIFICIIVAAAAGGVVAILGSIVGGQNIALAVQDQELLCRSEGSDDANECKNEGTAILRVANLNEYLTIQDQMAKLDTMNSQKKLLSRVFGVLDVILPEGDDTVWISELAVNMTESTISFDAQGDSISNIDYRALEVFKNIILLSYYDHGRYMRHDEETGAFVEIPTACITETVEGGIAYGIYHKGTPGCETSVLSEPVTPPAEGEDQTDEEGEQATGPVTSTVPVEDIKIRRDYRTADERSKQEEASNEVDGGRYYFDSKCITYKVDGSFDEEATHTKCPLSETGPTISDSSNGQDSGGNLVLRFTASIALRPDVFLSINKHMRIVGPTRQNVTDSYTQIRDMFTEEAIDCDPEVEGCLTPEPEETPTNGN